jgi:hypothetical protein
MFRPGLQPLDALGTQLGAMFSPGFQPLKANLTYLRQVLGAGRTNLSDMDGTGLHGLRMQCGAGSRRYNALVEHLQDRV